MNIRDSSFSGQRKSRNAGRSRTTSGEENMSLKVESYGDHAKQKGENEDDANRGGSRVRYQLLRDPTE